MTVALGPPLVVGDLAVAAIIQTQVSARQLFGGMIAASGSKVPLAVLVHNAGRLSAYRCDGRPMTLSEAERLCPGSIARMEADSVSRSRQSSPTDVR